ncbi:MAG TPA: hypothetical protein VLW55_07000 [Burkholderiaceae bacterium]|nr:hypothetical protein [Burkholderiaceae bacterium]
MASALALATPVTARAENAFAVFGGWRASGTFEDTVAQRDVSMRDTGSFALAFDFTYDDTRQYELFASRQSTSLAVTPVGSTSTEKFPVKVTYVHFGGTNYFDGPAGEGPFVAGGLGVTLLSPGLNGFDSETKPSLSVALGYGLPLGRYAALRVEGRGYFTLLNSSGGLFCNGGCTIAIKGDSFSQVELLIGLSARF